MNDSLKRVNAKNLYKLWDDGDFTSGNSYSVFEDTVIVPLGSRCVLRSFSANILLNSTATALNSLNINNAQAGGRVHFLDGLGNSVFTIKAELWASSGILGFSRNDIGLMCNIPCDGVLFENGMTVRLSAATGSDSEPAAPADPYGVNVNILYGGG